jgi:hypothetical protein
VVKERHYRKIFKKRKHFETGKRKEEMRLRWKETHAE